MRTSPKSKSLIAGLALLAASCGTQPVDDGNRTTSTTPSDTPPAVTLDGTSWVVTRGVLDGAPFMPVQDLPATLAVDSNRVTGSTGCNTYHATFSIAANGVTSLTGFAVTEIGCEPEVMQYEQAMLAALRAVDRFTWDADHLTLSNGDSSTTLDLVAEAAEPDAALDGGRWRLSAITHQDVTTSIIVGTSPFLVTDLTAGAVRGNGGCNDFGAEAAVDGDQITISGMVYTEIVCDQASMTQEADYFQILADAETWNIDGDTLTIATADGEAIVLIADAGEGPAEAALAWIMALSAGDLDTAAELMAPASLAYVGQRGGLSVFSTELAEGWGAWARVDDRRAWSVTGRFPDGTVATAVVLTGTVQQEGVEEYRTATLLLVQDGTYLVHPFTEAKQVGFVVPRADFVDRVAPEVPFELTVPKGLEVLVFIDDAGPFPVDIDLAPGGQLRVTTLANPLPVPGAHVLTVIHRSGDADIGAQSVHFTTYP